MPNSKLVIRSTSAANLDCCIASMRSHKIAFSTAGVNHGYRRCTAMTAEEIRPLLAAEYMKLERAQQLRLALSKWPHLRAQAELAVPAEQTNLEDELISKYAEDIGGVEFSCTYLCCV